MWLSERCVPSFWWFFTFHQIEVHVCSLMRSDDMRYGVRHANERELLATFSIICILCVMEALFHFHFTQNEICINEKCWQLHFHRTAAQLGSTTRFKQNNHFEIKLFENYSWSSITMKIACVLFLSINSFRTRAIIWRRTKYRRV